MNKNLGIHSPTINFVIFGSMRFGSNLLQEKLNYFADIICLGELYNPTFVGVDRPHLDKFSYAGYGRNNEKSQEKRMKNPFLLLEKVSDEAHAEKKLVGFRMFKGHNHSVRRVLINDSSVKKILLERNLIDSYVSLNLAVQTGQWVKREDKDQAPQSIHFNIEDFESYVKTNQHFFSSIEERLKATKQDFLKINYQDVLNNKKVKQIARFIGSRGKMLQYNTVLRKQNPDALERKIDNFKEVEEYILNFNQTVYRTT